MSAKYFVMSKNPITPKKKRFFGWIGKKSKKREKKPEDKPQKKNRKILIIIGAALFLLIVTLSVIGYFVYISSQMVKRVSVAELPNGDHQLLIGGRPYFVKGVCYIPTPIGKGYDYDLWTDKNKPWLVDGKLMKEMGVNTVRFYFHTNKVERGKEVIQTFYNNYGIRSAIGHYLNFWDYPHPNYGSPEVRARIKEDVIRMVKNYKDEPGILFWILGNENNYSFDRNVNPWTTEEIENLENPTERRKAKARIYYKFVNDLAREIKKIDPNHPVVMGNGELTSIKIAKEVCDDVDILGGIIYTGRTLGSFWKSLSRNFGKPGVMIEFGCDRYNAYAQEEDEDYQAFFLKSQWLEVEKNKANGTGEGNSLGGFVFEWNDEWWKYNEQYPADWAVQNAEGGWSNSAYYFDAEAENNMNEEWWGVIGLSTEKTGAIDKRVPKKSYYILKKLWKE